MEFEANLVYSVSSRRVRATLRTPVSKKKKKRKLGCIWLLGKSCATVRTRIQIPRSLSERSRGIRR